MNESGLLPRQSLEEYESTFINREDRDYIWQTVSTIPIEVGLNDPALAITAERSLAVINPTQRAILSARFISGEPAFPSHSEIAQRFSTTSANISQTVAIGRQILEKVMPDIAAGTFDYAGREDQGRNPHTVLGLLAKANLPIPGTSRLDELGDSVRTYIEASPNLAELEKIHVLSAYGLSSEHNAEKLPRKIIQKLIGKLIGNADHQTGTVRNIGLYDPTVDLNQARILAGEEPIAIEPPQEQSEDLPVVDPIRIPDEPKPKISLAKPLNMQPETNVVDTTYANPASSQKRKQYNSTVDWRHQALCAGEDPETFFPIGTGGPALRQIAIAKNICRQCPVVAECLDWAIDSGQNHGVWGGMAEDERRALKRRNNRQNARITA